MERREKAEFILEQMRLCLAKDDFIRAQIISKKISPKFFKDESTHDLKLKYHNQMLQLAAHDKRCVSFEQRRRGESKDKREKKKVRSTCAHEQTHEVCVRFTLLRVALQLFSSSLGVRLSQVS